MRAMRNYWSVLILFYAASANAQFVKNSGLTVINSASVSVNGDWDNQSSSMVNDGIITLTDNWTSVAGYSSSSTGEFILTNTVTKQFNHNGQSVSFFTKNGAGDTQVNNRLTVRNNLKLQNGVLSMTGSVDTLVIAANAVITANSTSYVAGKIARYGTGDLFFPVSKGSNYLPITIYQLAGTSPRVTISVEDAPLGYTAGVNVSSLTSFPYAWRSAAVGADTATFIEIELPTAIASPAPNIVVRKAGGKTYSGMGAQSLFTTNGVTKIKSNTQGLRGLFSVGIASLVTGGLEASPSSLIEVFPNPVADWLTISFGNASGSKEVSVYHLDGKRTTSQIFFGEVAKFNVADYAQGIYILKISSENSVRVVRFAKQ